MAGANADYSISTGMTSSKVRELSSAHHARLGCRLKSIAFRNLEEPSIEGACRPGQARGCSSTGVARNEEEAGRRGSGVKRFGGRGLSDR